MNTPEIRSLSIFRGYSYILPPPVGDRHLLPNSVFTQALNNTMLARDTHKNRYAGDPEDPNILCSRFVNVAGFVFSPDWKKITLCLKYIYIYVCTTTHHATVLLTVVIKIPKKIITSPPYLPFGSLSCCCHPELNPYP